MENFAIELFLRGFALCLLAGLALVLLRRTAAAHRHLVCALALLILLMLPLAAQFMPPLRLLPPQMATTLDRAPVAIEGARRLSGGNAKPEMPTTLEEPQTPRVSTKSGPPLLPESVSLSRSEYAVALLCAIWGAGAVLLLIRLLVALFRLRGLEGRSRKETLGSVSIRVSEEVQTPLTWGIRRSVILLPWALLSGERAVCESALLHEQAHIARWDWGWNLLSELVCAVCWFQPGAWWLRSRMRLESERACDDRVLLSGVAGPDYAAHLLQILRSVGSNEVAPAMAQNRRGMEARMRHILDGAKPRHAPVKWLAVSATLALALLSSAALRVSARPTEARGHTDSEAATMNPKESPSRQTKSADAAEKSAAMDEPEGNASPSVRFENVVWSKAADGLEPGFLLNTPGLDRNKRVPLNSRLDYKVLVRNVSRHEIFIGVRCGIANPWNDDPYLLPNDALKDALRSGILPERFRARGLTKLVPWPAGYDLKLAPGEAVVVPGEQSLYLRDADKASYPRIEAIQTGKNWLVQPITIHLLTAEEQAETERLMHIQYSGNKTVTTLGRDGKTGHKPAVQVGARSGGKQIFARMSLEIGASGVAAVKSAVGAKTPLPSGDAPGNPPAASAALQGGGAPLSVPAASKEPADIVWGPEGDVQAGLRARLWAAPQHAARFIFDVYIRNRTKQALNVSCPSFAGLTVPTDSDYSTELQSNLIYCTPHLQDSKGKAVEVAFKPGEEDSQFVLLPGQAVNVSHWMLRTIDIRAKGSQRADHTLVAFVESGKHRLYCDVSVSRGSQRTMLRTGKAAFDVIGADVAAE